MSQKTVLMVEVFAFLLVVLVVMSGISLYTGNWHMLIFKRYFKDLAE